MPLAQFTAPPAQPAPAAPPAPESAAELPVARRGDSQAFAQLVKQHQARVFSVALRLTGHREDAEELAQDAFVQLHGVLPQLADEQHVRHWLLRAVTHRSIDRLRRRERRPRLVSLEDAAEVAGPDATPDVLAQRRLAALLLQLAPAPRAVVLLRFQQDLDPSDIAAVLDMSLNTVKSHLRRSLEWLRAQHAGAGDGY